MQDAQHTILFVDDEVNILSALQRLLRKEAYRVLTASSGEAGLTLLQKHPVDLVISDQRMPGMSGTEFLACVKRG
jgi:response regulator RpfG family c-di-GMP phosphodiesterase